MSANEEMLRAAPDDMTVFMLVKTMPEWLGMSIDQRFETFNRVMAPILKRHGDQVRFRFYDTEFYSARVTDVWVWDVKSRHSYEMVVEALRESPMWDRLFSIVEILAGVENAYARNYDRQAISG
jgi:hypothetical protein